MSFEYIPAGLYNVNYYNKWPSPYCGDEHSQPPMLRINGVCTDLTPVLDVITNDSASSGNCPALNKQVGNMCIPTNKSFTTAMPGAYSLGTANVQVGPLFPAEGTCI